MIFLAGLTLFIGTMYAERWFPNSDSLKFMGGIGLLLMAVSVLILIGRLMP